MYCSGTDALMALLQLPLSLGLLAVSHAFQNRPDRTWGEVSTDCSRHIRPKVICDKASGERIARWQPQHVMDGFERTNPADVWIEGYPHTCDFGEFGTTPNSTFCIGVILNELQQEGVMSGFYRPNGIITVCHIMAVDSPDDQVCACVESDEQ